MFYILLSLQQFIYSNKTIAIKKNIKRKKKGKKTIISILIVYLIFAQY